MKITDKLVEKFGYDKLLHFLVAAWAVSEFKIYGIGIACIAWILIVILSWIKEEFLDGHADARDIFAGALGGFISLLLMIVKALISG